MNVRVTLNIKKIVRFIVEVLYSKITKGKSHDTILIMMME